VIVSAALALLTVVLAGGSSAGTDLELLDLDGRPVSVLPPAIPATVFVFARTDCPITNRYAPELRRLRDRFAKSGVRFWLVYPDPAEAPEAVRRHAAEFDFGMAPLRDPKHALVVLAGARVTPEAAVFVAGDAGPRLVYRGRIDDRNVAFGKTRASPTKRDLETVLAALAEGKAVPARTTTAIGCAIASLE
jgi:AhpC/TSA family protein